MKPAARYWKPEDAGRTGLARSQPSEGVLDGRDAVVERQERCHVPAREHERHLRPRGRRRRRASPPEDGPCETRALRSSRRGPPKDLPPAPTRLPAARRRFVCSPRGTGGPPPPGFPPVFWGKGGGGGRGGWWG